jgi:hypothetical protein
VDLARARLFLLWGVLSVCLHVAAFETLRPHVRDVGDPAPTRSEISGDTVDLQQPPAQDSEADRGSTRAPEPSAEDRGGDLGPRARVGSAARNAVSRDEPRSLFGAVGARFATDLSATFTRALPQASSADPAWTNCPPGTAGTADVTLVLDNAGHLMTQSVLGHPSPALRSSIERTLALLAERSFTAGQATTRLRVTGHVALDDLHDGLHGDVFALSGGSFVGSAGNAFFALPARTGPGRRVDVEVRVLR